MLKKNITFVFAFLSLLSFSQNQIPAPKTKNAFLKKIEYGGAFGLNIGNDFTNIILAPSAIYPVNDFFATGIGLQGSLVSSKGNYYSLIYGGSLIGIFNPIEVIQLSLELEQLRVNRTYSNEGQNNIKDNFWNTGLLLGAGYRTGKVTLGIRYNLLYNANDLVYDAAFTPFFRVYF